MVIPIPRTLQRRLVTTAIVLAGLCAIPFPASAGPEGAANNGPGAGTARDTSTAAGATGFAAFDGEDSLAYEAETYNMYEPGRGYQVAKAPQGDLWISAYVVWRYINQLPAEQTFVGSRGHPAPRTVPNSSAARRGGAAVSSPGVRIRQRCGRKCFRQGTYFISSNFTSPVFALPPSTGVASIRQK